MSYDLLSDLLVLEVSQYGPDALGGYLADLGARVIKVEPPKAGDPLRRAGALAVGSPDGYSYLHLRWNRGKESLELDLRDPEGRADFLKLAAKSDVVIEGMRAGGLDRLGLGYSDLKRTNPAIVFCSVSGMGRSGEYARMASHGPSFDAFGGIGVPTGGSISRYEGRLPAAVGMHSVSLHAAAGVLAAVLKARRTGSGALIEVSAAESAAHWLPEVLDAVLNEQATFDRPDYLDSLGRMKFWARMENYRTADDRLVFIQCLTDKSWRALLKVIGRPDLQDIYDRTPATGTEDSEVAAELAKIISEKSLADWQKAFRAENVAAMPVNDYPDVVKDPHFVGRGNTYKVSLPSGQELTLTSTPIRVEGATFSAPLAPELGEHNARLRAEFGLDAVEV